MMLLLFFFFKSISIKMNPGYSENEAPTHVIIKIVHPDQCSRTNEGSQGFFWGGVVWGFFFCNTLTSVIHICVLYPQSHTKNTINPQQKPLSETKTKQNKLHIFIVLFFPIAVVHQLSY